jgi:hypothetical protein
LLHSVFLATFLLFCAYLAPRNFAVLSYRKTNSLFRSVENFVQAKTDPNLRNQIQSKSHNLVTENQGGPIRVVNHGEEGPSAVFPKEYLKLGRKIVPTDQTIKTLKPFVGYVPR